MAELGYRTRIKVFGVGGAGNNAVNRMVQSNLEGVEFYVANTDSQDLNGSICENKILLGAETTRCLGAGGDRMKGQAAAEESAAEIKEAVKDADLIFVTAGMGGGTGTGASPVFAKYAKEAGALTIGVVTKPFEFEGPLRAENSRNGLVEFRKYVDSLIVVSNERLIEILGDINVEESFTEADNVLRQAIQTITDLIQHNSEINLDFADIEAVMKGNNVALIGVGEAYVDEHTAGIEVARKAADMAISCPLLEATIKGAKKAIINVSGGSKLTLNMAREAVKYIQSATEGDLNVYYGMTYINALENRVVVSVIATGFDDSVIQPESPILDSSDSTDEFELERTVFSGNIRG